MSVKKFFDNFENEFNIFLNDYIVNNEIEIYNEFNFQHEFGIYLRDKLKDYKVEFERNVEFFGINYNDKDINYSELLKEGYQDKEKLLKQLKHEIDIVVYNKDKSEKYAIELKYPSIKSYYDEEKQEEVKRSNGAYPKEMYSFIQDIKFMEVLKERAFTKTFCITLVNVKDAKANKNFYDLSSRASDNEIYKYFRIAESKKNEIKIKGVIPMPTGEDSEKKAVYINGEYNANWNSWLDKAKTEIGKYYVVTID